MLGRFFRGNEKAEDVFAPPCDPVFSNLYGRVVAGYLPLYRAKVPTVAIRPFSDAYLPHKTTDGRKAMEAMKRDFEAGKIALPLWLYPSEGVFVLSDDYIPFFLLKELGVQDYWCTIMGQFEHPEVSEIQGPAPREYVQTLPGGANFDPKRGYQFINE
jgi:hypothetical protein